MFKQLLFILCSALMFSFTGQKRFEFGTATNPKGETMYVDSKGFIINGKRCIPVAGEMHFQRIPFSEWRNELLKMKAGGIDIVSTYVFWGIIEPEEGGPLDFSGSNDLRKFIEECGRCGLKVLLRPGPWVHGEWYLGGMPEWIIDKWKSDPKKYELRSMAPIFLTSVKRYFNALGEQTKGLMWKDGGPIVGFQVDNEFYGPWAYLHALKNLAIEAGFDLPFYTKTECPHMDDNGDKGEMLPLAGNYVDGFWCGLTDKPAGFEKSFEFKDLRWNADPEGNATQKSKPEETICPCPIPGMSYPNLMCELGTGMMTSYNRRVRIYDNDIRASVITRIGIGSNMPGYYMYHGGTNPWSPKGTLAECRNSNYTNANDLPRRTYDFQAPLGEMGIPNLWYHHLRLINQFLHDWGAELSEMKFRLGDSEVRSAIRENGKSGFVFVNNYERMRPLGSNKLNFEDQVITVPEGSSFFFPFGLAYKSLHIEWATAQPFCMTEKAIYFAAVKGIEAKLCIDGKVISPQLDKPYKMNGNTILVMSPEKSLTAYKVKDKVLFCKDIVYEDGNKVMCESWKNGADISVKKLNEANPARVPDLVGGLPMFPNTEEMQKAASWSLTIPKMKNAEDWLVAISYHGDIAQVWADDVMVEDNFWNGKTMYVRASELVGKNVVLKILPLTRKLSIYFQKEQRDELASHKGDCLCALDSIRLIHRIRKPF